LRATSRTYYLKELPQLPKAQLYGCDYFSGRTSNYEGGVLKRWGENNGLRYDRHKYYKGVARKIASRKPTSVLEVGCGVGFTVRELLHLGVSTVGVDVSPWAIQHRVTPEVTVADAVSLPFKDKEFDLVFSHDVLEHIPVQELPKVFDELDRVGTRNYHIISCGSLPNDRDITHVTMKPLSWWRSVAPQHFELERRK